MKFENIGEVTHAEARTVVRRYTDDGEIIERYQPNYHDHTLCAIFFSVYAKIEDEWVWFGDFASRKLAKLYLIAVSNAFTCPFTDEMISIPEGGENDEEETDN